MANMKVGTSQYTPSYEVEQKPNSKNGSLNGFSFPKNELETLEHSMFLGNKLGNNVCPEIYAVNVSNVVSNIKDAKKLRQLTGEGGGAG
jgi:hypothetical protein